MGQKIGLGIDVGMQGLRFAKIATEQNHICVCQLHFFPLPGNEEDNFSPQTARDLRVFLKANGIKSAKALAGISGEHLNICYVRVAPVSTQRLASIVAIEAEQMMVTASSDMGYGYVNLGGLGKDAKSQCEHLIAIAISKSGFLDRLHHFFRLAGVDVKGFIPNSFALFHAFSKLGKIPQNQTVYLVNLDIATIDVALCYESTLYFLRNINIGNSVLAKSVEPDNDLDLAEMDVGQDEKPQTIVMKAPPSIPDALLASLKFAKMQTRLAMLQVNGMYITGGGKEPKEIMALLQNRLGYPVSQLLPDEANIAFVSSEIQEELQESFPQYSLALGLAHLHACHLDISLKMIGSRQKLHELILGRRLFEYASLSLSVILILVVAVVAYSTKSQWQKHRRYLQEQCTLLETKSQQTEEVHGQKQLLQKKVTTLKEPLNSNAFLIEAIQWLEQNMPSHMYLTDLEFKNTDGKINLIARGILDESLQSVYQELSDFQKLLEKSYWKVEDLRPVADNEKDPKKLDFTLVLSPRE